MKDADAELPQKLETGVTAGILNPLPRVPALFDPQVKWRLKQDPLAVPELRAENYCSLADHLDEVGVAI